MKQRLLVVLLAVASLLAACGSPATTPPESSEEPSTAASPGRSAGASAVVVPESPVAGVVIAVESRGLNDVRGFTLRSNAGETLVFVMGELENAADFPPGHLTEHQAAAAPVLVFFRDKTGSLVAYRIEDAG